MLIAFLSKESILNWAENVLRSVNLNEKEREYIFHRFSTCFLIEKVSIKNLVEAFL